MMMHHLRLRLGAPGPAQALQATRRTPAGMMRRCMGPGPWTATQGGQGVPSTPGRALRGRSRQLGHSQSCPWAGRAGRPWASVGVGHTGAVLRGQPRPHAGMGPHEAVRGGGLASFRGPDRAARARLDGHRGAWGGRAASCVPGGGHQLHPSAELPLRRLGGPLREGARWGLVAVWRPGMGCIRSYARHAGGRLPSFTRVAAGDPRR